MQPFGGAFSFHGGGIAGAAVKVFVIPSWYPSVAKPMAGGFVRDQVAALARVRPAWTQVVSLWGHHDGALSLRRAADSARALRWRMAARTQWRDAPGWFEISTPRLSWTLAFAQGGAAGLLQATRHNLRLAEERFGAMDVLHAHVGFPAGWMASQITAEIITKTAAQRRLPYVLTEHMSPFPVPPLMGSDGDVVPRLRQAFEDAAATVAVSPSLADRLLALRLPCSDVIPNVVDETRFVLADQSPRAAPPFVFFSLCALTPQKGVDLLLQAFAHWRPAVADVQLHIAGDGPERVRLQALAQQLGIADRVRWLGPVSPHQVPGLMAGCDAFVLASRHETFGVVLVEALMSGKPVLATQCGGPQSVVDAGNGVLVEAGSVGALAVGLQIMRSKASSFAPSQLRADAIARFGQQAVGARWAALFERVVSA